MKEGGPAHPFILHLEDDPNDSILMVAHLEREGILGRITRVDTRDAFLKSIEDQELDLIVADYSLPSFDGITALELASDLRPDLPFILLSGTLGEDVAIECMRRGATDYVLKEGMQRIAPAVRRALEMANERRQRVRLEQRLRETLEILNASTAVAFLWRNEPGWPVEHVSESVTGLLGESAEELLSRPLLYMDRVHPDDRDRVAADRRPLADGEFDRVTQSRYRLLHADGSERWVEDRSVAHRQKGDSVTHLRGIVIDITARHVAQEEVRRLTDFSAGILSSINDGFGLFDENDRWIFVNDAGARMLGREPETLLGTDFSELVADNRDEVYSAAIERRRMGESEYYELNLRHRDGRRVPVGMTSSARLENGSFIGSMSVFKDLSERREAEEERRRLEDHLRQSQKLEALGTLAGGIAHDFNNILQVMMMSAEVLEGCGFRDETAPETLHELRQTISRAGRLVQQILAFSRRSDEAAEPMYLQPLVKEVIKMLREMVPSTIEISSRIDRDCPPVVADATQVHQIIMNLCTNAYQAMQRNRGTIKVRLSSREIAHRTEVPGLEPGRFACLSVADTGVGMAPEVLERIFDPYFTTKEKGHGTGLGLAVVHGIVTKHDGVIDVESRPGDGTRFTVYLPAIDELPEQLTAPDAAIMRGSERILCVDDEVGLVTLQQRMLTNLGYVVAIATSPEDALRLLEDPENLFDLMITDQTMPKLSGVDLIARVRPLRPELPIVLCSGFSEEVNAEVAPSLGARYFLSKPFTKKELAGAVRRVLDEKR